MQKEPNQKYYKNNFANPGTLMYTRPGNDDNGNRYTSTITSDYTPKVMISGKTTMTQHYPPVVDDQGEAYLHVQFYEPFTVQIVGSYMFSGLLANYPLLAAGANGIPYVNLCKGQKTLTLNNNAEQVVDKTGKTRTQRSLDIALHNTDYTVVGSPSIAALSGFYNNINKGCQNVQQCPNTPALSYARWYDCVASVYRQYWRPYNDQYTGYKRGERIITVLKADFLFDVNDLDKSELNSTTGQKIAYGYNDFKSLLEAGIIQLDKKQQFKDLLEAMKFDPNGVKEGYNQNATVTVQVRVFQDYDIGLDMWTVAITIVLAVISLWFIVTIKCIPSFGKKIYSCCPSLFEIEDTSKIVDAAVEEPKEELVVAQDGVQEEKPQTNEQ